MLMAVDIGTITNIVIGFLEVDRIVGSYRITTKRRTPQTNTV